VASSVIGQSVSWPVINISSLESNAERSVEAAMEIEVKAKSESLAERDVIYCLENSGGCCENSIVSHNDGLLE
jgi:hypothetical protein